MHLLRILVAFAAIAVTAATARPITANGVADEGSLIPRLNHMAPEQRDLKPVPPLKATTARTGRDGAGSTGPEAGPAPGMRWNEAVCPERLAHLVVEVEESTMHPLRILLALAALASTAVHAAAIPPSSLDRREPIRHEHAHPDRSAQPIKSLQQRGVYHEHVHPKGVVAPPAERRDMQPESFESRGEKISSFNPGTEALERREEAIDIGSLGIYHEHLNTRKVEAPSAERRDMQPESFESRGERISSFNPGADALERREEAIDIGSLAVWFRMHKRIYVVGVALHCSAMGGQKTPAFQTLQINLMHPFRILLALAVLASTAVLANPIPHKDRRAAAPGNGNGIQPPLETTSSE
ncbi:hypothetical protein HDU96_004200 [Phlyctochytrium bullatum]|nr:hypothetical protein HDU96_004200 [Phlyctochytrium bullatum]